MRKAVKCNLKPGNKIKGNNICKAVGNNLVHRWPSINDIHYYYFTDFFFFWSLVFLGPEKKKSAKQNDWHV